MTTRWACKSEQSRDRLSRLAGSGNVWTAAVSRLRPAGRVTPGEREALALVDFNRSQISVLPGHLSGEAQPSGINHQLLAPTREWPSAVELDDETVNARQSRLHEREPEPRKPTTRYADRYVRTARENRGSARASRPHPIKRQSCRTNYPGLFQSMFGEPCLSVPPGRAFAIGILPDWGAYG